MSGTSYCVGELLSHPTLGNKEAKLLALNRGNFPTVEAAVEGAMQHFAAYASDGRPFRAVVYSSQSGDETMVEIRPAGNEGPFVSLGFYKIIALRWVDATQPNHDARENAKAFTAAETNRLLGEIQRNASFTVDAPTGGTSLPSPTAVAG